MENGTGWCFNREPGTRQEPRLVCVVGVEQVIPGLLLTLHIFLVIPMDETAYHVLRSFMQVSA